MADVEKHLDETVRDQWESPVQWDARKKFILHNWDQHPEDQLVCLSNVWANMEFLGCRYNSVVEQRVKEMAAGMPEFQKPELPQQTDEQDDKKNRNDGGGYVKPKKAELIDSLTRTEVFGSKEAREEQIKETNIGYQMLRKMGWSGGGIGKEGREGIAEPIKVNVLKRRAGLGTATDLAEKQSAKPQQVVLNYVQPLEVATRIDPKTEAALSKLRQTNPVVKPKKAELTEDALTRTEVFGSKKAGEEQIKEANIGLGTATDLAEKQSAKAHQVILNYVQSGREDDLVFSPELTSQERGAIHEIAKQYNLQHKSFGEGKKRYIVLMRRRSAQDVMAQAQFRPGQYRTVVGDGKYEIEDCQIDTGTSYRGTVAVTKTDRTCQRWDSQTPHEHTRTPASYPSSGLEQNYCRNPDDEAGVWCYTTDADKRDDFCDVPVCGCSENSDGSDYRGNVSVTRSGKTCQRWDVSDSWYPPEDYPELVENYCRNPDGADYTIWCYTTDPDDRWDYCIDPSHCI
ncbi:LPA [Branchiostoma lanceolatum]|uniref:LPA protein n=1 Tax=Branchiostoma lanceolatum TaxID=7740 RepID=A0A8K0A2P0_BRALA|nr:LPA [Branchiostoma lanceolatum]